MTTWVNIVHLYQPPTCDKATLDVVVNECYRPLSEKLLATPTWRLTANISASLDHLLHEFGHKDILQNFKTLIERGQIELIDTAAFHPILPLVPEQEVRKQISINQEMHAQYLGITTAANGFWLPECAYSSDVAKIIKDMGYTWIVLDEISYNGSGNPIDPTVAYEIEKIGLRVVFRNREHSRTYVPKHIQTLFEQNNLPQIIITATDGELYGHRYHDVSDWLQQVLANKAITTTTVQDYLKTLTTTKPCSPVASNWDSEVEELANDLPYFQWKNPNNTIQELLWDLATTAYGLIEANEGIEEYWWARQHLERGLSSCHFWWASGKDFELFSHPAWKPDEIEKGATELIKGIRSLPIDAKHKLAAEEKFIAIHKAVWQTHWKQELLS